PHLSNKVRYLAKMFPNSKFVVLVRPIHSQVASLKRHFQNALNNQGHHFYLPDVEHSCWAKYEGNDSEIISKSAVNNFKSIPEAWIRLNYIMLKDIESVNNQSIVIDYNQLVGNQSKILVDVFDFLDLEEKHKGKEKGI